MFGVIVVVAMAFDLGVFHRKAHVVSAREAAVWTAVWTGLALGFNAYVFARHGHRAGVEFFFAWLLEQALSIDNIFVFLVVFSYFRVPEQQQHRVLFWGIIGAVVTRGVFIFAGVALIHMFTWVMYVLGGVLLITAVRLLLQGDEEIHPERNPVLRVFRRFVPSVPTYEGSRFTVRRDGRTYATPLFAVLVVVEATDVVFAVDSIPAVFGVTTDVFIVYTSNIFAILGLRSLCFLIAGLMKRLHYLKVGLSFVLGFIGVKILIAHWYEVPLLVSLGVLAGILALATAASVLFPPSGKGAAAPPGADEADAPEPRAGGPTGGPDGPPPAG